MVECWICGRAMVTNPLWLPWPICDRARCKHSKDDLVAIMAAEHTRKDYEMIAEYS